MSNSGNLGILLGHAFFRIDDKHDDIGALYRADGADDHITLQLFFNFIFASKTCRINEDVLFSIMHYLGIHRIPRCTCNIGNDHPVFTDQAVNNGRFADIWFSDNRNFRTIILLFHLCIFREMTYNFVQHIADPHPVCRRDRPRITDSQIIKLIDIRHVFLEAVYFVDYQNHRLVGTAQHIRYLGICIHQSLLDIYHKQNHVRRVDGDLCLLPHLGQNDVPGIRLDTAGINQGKIFIQPRNVRINTVSCNARCILYDGDHLSRQCVEQCRFSDIGSANYCNDWLSFSCHICSFPYNGQHFSRLSFGNALIFLNCTAAISGLGLKFAQQTFRKIISA